MSACRDTLDRLDDQVPARGPHALGRTTNFPLDAFNDYGERTTMSTFRGGSGWNGTAGSVPPGTADTTTWAYDPAAGTLTSKTDAASGTVSYTYTPAASSRPAPGPAASSPPTPTPPPPPSSRASMQEDLGSFAGSRSVTYQYDTTGTGTRGRLTYLGLGLTSALGGEYNFTYGYHAVARLNQIWTFTYTYLANSNLIAAISDSASSWTQTRTYEASQPLLDVIETKLAVATKARFDYANDALGRRTSVAKTGEMYARYSAAGLDTHSGYNDRAEVTREQSRLGVSAGGEYLLQLKGNAPAVQAATVLAVTSTCTVKKTGATSTETRLFVSSAAAKACTPRQWLARRRGHWSVESANHYRRDVTWREDAELGRKAACACNLAPIRSALFGALLRDGPLNLSADTQRCIARPGAALRFLRAAHPSHEPNRKAVTRTAAARYLSCS